MNTQIPYVRIAIPSHKRVRTFQVRLSASESVKLKQRYERIDKISSENRLKSEKYELEQFIYQGD